MIQTAYSRNFKLQSSTILSPETRKNASSGGISGPKMEMESGRDGWEMRLAVQKNILPRSQILTNGETPLERDGWSRERELVLNEKKMFCYLNFGNLSNLEKVMCQSGL